MSFVAERAKSASSVTAGNGKTFTIPVSGITPGNMIVVAIALATNAFANLTVTDDQSNSYGSSAGQTGASASIVPWVSFPSVAPSVITVHIDNTSGATFSVGYKVLEFSGVINARDTSQFGYQATGTNVTLPSLVTTNANDFYIGFVASSVAQIAPSGITTGFVFAGSTRNAAPDICAFYKYGTGIPSGAVTVAWNASCASAYSASAYAAPAVNSRTMADTGLTVTDSIVRTTTAKPFGYVGERAKGGGTNIATGSGKTFTIPVSGGTVGNSLYLALYALSKLVTLVSVTDDVGNTYHIDQSLVGSGGRTMWIVSGYMAAAPTTLTITTNNSGGSAVAESYKVEEFSGGRNPPAFDTGYIEEETSASNFPSGAAVGGAGSGELYFYAYGADVNPGAYTPGSGMTQAGTARGANPDIVAEYNLATLNASSSSVGSFATGSAGIGAQTMYLRGIQSRTLSDTGLTVSDTLTTAYPVYTSPVQWLARGTRNGPWLVGGALYVFGNEGSAATLRCFKSTDGGKTWAEVDAAHHPTNTTSSYDTFLNGSTIWVEYLDGGSNTIHVRPFANDLWGADSPNGPALGSRTNSGGRVTCIAGVRANGDVVITHQSTQETVSGTLRDRIGVSVYSGGVWVADQILGTGIAAHFDHVAAALGASDRVHMFYTRTDQTTSLQHRSLSSANVLDTEVAVATNLINVTDACVCGLAAGFVNGANTEIVVPYKTSGNILGVVRFFSQANPSVFTRTNVSTLQPDTTNGLIAAEVNGTTVTIFFCDFASKDIYLNSDGGTNTWGTDTLVTIANDQWGVTAQPISQSQAGLVFSDTQAFTTILYLPVKTIPIQTYGRSPTDTGLSVSDTLAHTVNRTTMGDFGLLFSESLSRSYIRPLLMSDTGLTVSDKLRKQPRPIDNGLNISDSIARTVALTFRLGDAGLAFFDSGITSSTPKSMADTGLAVSTILRRYATRLMQDTGVVSGDAIQASQHALGLYVQSITVSGITPGATDSIRLAKGIIRITDTGVTVVDLFAHISVTMPVRGARRWMAGHGAGSDMTG